jgi:hypothetical protein
MLDELLLQVARLSQIAKPDDRDLSTLREWIMADTGGKRFLQPSDRGIYKEKPGHYVHLQPPDPENDIIPDLILDLYDRYIQRGILVGNSTSFIDIQQANNTGSGSVEKSG